MSLCGQYYREYVLDKDTAVLVPTFLYGVPTESGLYYDLMHMMKWDRNMQKPVIINAWFHSLSLLSPLSSFLFAAAD